MSDLDEESVDESISLLSEHQHGYKAKKPLSILKARLVSTLVPVFAMSAMTARDTLMAQFLVARLGNDAGHLNHTTFKSCGNYSNDSSSDTTDAIESEATDLQAYYGYAQCVPAFFTCLFIGSYSDYLGRRFLLLLPVCTTMLKTFMITFIIRFHLDLRLMYVAYGLDGLSGSWFTILLAMYALTADISAKQKERTFWIYFVSCSAAIMEAIANIAIGYLIEHYGYFEASLLLSLMMAVAFFFPLFLLPETHLHRPGTKEYNPLVHLRRIFGFYFFEGSVRKRATYCLCLLLFVIGVANLVSQSSTDALYQMHQPFCWGSTQIGYYDCIRGAGAYVLGAIFLIVMQRFMTSEKIAMIGLLFQGSSFIYEAFLWKSWQFYLVPIIGSPGAPLTSIIRTMLSVLTGPERQGALFSSVAVVESIVALVGVVAWNKIYGATVDFMPGFVYIMMAACSFMTFVMFIVYLQVREKPQPIKDMVIVEHPDIQ